MLEVVVVLTFSDVRPHSSFSHPPRPFVDQSWDGFDWKEPPKEANMPYDGWPGIRRQVHWEPNRGGAFQYLISTCFPTALGNQVWRKLSMLTLPCAAVTIFGQVVLGTVLHSSGPN